MPAKRKNEAEINLLPQKGFESTTSGRILAWILSTFRIIVIVTEIIVMIAFLSRFYFDAQNTDLNEKIQQKEAILKASKDFETKFKDVQKRLTVYTSLTQGQNTNSETLDLVTKSVPSDVILSQLHTREKTIEIKALTPSEKSIEQFIVNLSAEKKLTNVNLLSVSTDPKNSTLLIFEITALLPENLGG
jgi:Tfp pilus assembly protein PilN